MLRISFDSDSFFREASSSVIFRRQVSRSTFKFSLSNSSGVSGTEDFSGRALVPDFLFWAVVEEALAGRGLTRVGGAGVSAKLRGGRSVMDGWDVTGGVKEGTKGWAVVEEALAGWGLAGAGGAGIFLGSRGGRGVMVGGAVKGGVKEGTKGWATGLRVGIDFGVETGDWMENVTDVDEGDDKFKIGDLEKEVMGTHKLMVGRKEIVVGGGDDIFNTED